MVVRSRDSRRRRVMLDESVQCSAATNSTGASLGSPSKQKPPKADKPKRLYGFGAERRSQPKTTDLLPKRWPAFTTVVAGLLGSLVALNVIAIYSSALKPYLGDAGVAAFSLQGTGTLAAWFCSALMAVSAVVCWQIYFLRKHRCSDYRGSYRLWCWVAPLFLLGSIAGSVNAAGMVTAWEQNAGHALPSVGPVSAICFLQCLGLTALAVIGIWETRLSRGSMALVTTAWMAGLGSLLSTVPIADAWIDEAGISTVASNGWPVFATLAFLSVLTYARYVYLAANGMLPTRSSSAQQSAQHSANVKAAIAKPTPKLASKTRKPKKQAASKSSSVKATQTPAASLKPTAPAAVPPAKSKQDSAVETDEAPTLSKAERRRQRKLQRRQNRAA